MLGLKGEIQFSANAVCLKGVGVLQGSCAHGGQYQASPFPAHWGQFPLISGTLSAPEIISERPFGNSYKHNKWLQPSFPPRWIHLLLLQPKAPAGAYELINWPLPSMSHMNRSSSQTQERG